jgi:hypothetical protein
MTIEHFQNLVIGSGVGYHGGKVSPWASFLESEEVAPCLDRNGWA